MNTETLHKPDSSVPGSAPCADLLAAAVSLEGWISSMESHSGEGRLPADFLDFPILDRLRHKFSLDAFEASLVVILGLLEVNAEALERLHVLAGYGSPRPVGLTPAHCQRLMPDAFHPGSFLEDSPLRCWDLVQMPENRFEPHPLPHRCLRLSPRILNHLLGRDRASEPLASFLESALPEPVLTPGQLAVLPPLVGWLRSIPHFEAHQPVQLAGPEPDTLMGAAFQTASQVGLRLVRMPAGSLPTDPHENRELMQLWQREALLTDSALFLDATGLEAGSINKGPLGGWLQGCRGAVFVGTPEDAVLECPVFFCPVPPTLPKDRLQLMRNLLGDRDAELAEEAEVAAEQFNLSAATLFAACQHVRATAENGGSASERLWQECRKRARPRSCHLMHRANSRCTWEDLVLPEDVLKPLRELALQVRFRKTVHEDWGFAAKGLRGLNLTALFSGPSGTGKTLAAEVVANELQLDLVRVDLSSVVSKYIGETEENLREVFDAAETGGVVLLFDEADALFGPRSRVQDSRDRNANMEVSYLLQRLEAFGGLALLTTNFRENIDPAFQRRIRFHVEFPFPDREIRSRIWRAVFPPGTPLEGIDFCRLGRLSLTGGHIRNIALNAAFLAAAGRSGVRPCHIVEAARNEFRKMEKPSPESELRALLQNAPTGT